MKRLRERNLSQCQELLKLLQPPSAIWNLRLWNTRISVLRSGRDKSTIPLVPLVPLCTRVFALTVFFHSWSLLLPRWGTGRFISGKWAFVNQQHVDSFEKGYAIMPTVSANVKPETAASRDGKIPRAPHSQEGETCCLVQDFGGLPVVHGSKFCISFVHRTRKDWRLHDPAEWQFRRDALVALLTQPRACLSLCRCCKGLEKQEIWLDASLFQYAAMCLPRFLVEIEIAPPDWPGFPPHRQLFRSLAPSKGRAPMNGGGANLLHHQPPHTKLPAALPMEWMLPWPCL